MQCTRVPRGISPRGREFPISGATGEGIKELLYAVNEALKGIEKKTIHFEQEFFPEEELAREELPLEIYKEQEGVYVVQGPRVEKMLGYTNLESERGFVYFQRFLKTNGILDELKRAGIRDGDTVKMYGHRFDYYDDDHVFEEEKDRSGSSENDAEEEA